MTRKQWAEKRAREAAASAPVPIVPGCETVEWVPVLDGLPPPPVVRVPFSTIMRLPQGGFACVEGEIVVDSNGETALENLKLGSRTALYAARSQMVNAHHRHLQAILNPPRKKSA